MNKINFIDLNIGNYCTAYEIGAKVKELTGNNNFFKDKNSDGQERIGRWVNAEAGTIYKNDVKRTLSGIDAISLPVSENSVLLDVWAAQGLINEKWYIRHGKLDLYSDTMAELIIRSFTGILYYYIAQDMNIIFDYRHAPVEWTHNDISSKYVHKNCYKSGLPRKSLLGSSRIKSDEISKLRAEAEKMVNSIDHNRKVKGDDILVYFPSHVVPILRFYWKLSKARMWYRGKLIQLPRIPKDIDGEVSHFTRDMVEKFFNY